MCSWHCFTLAAEPLAQDSRCLLAPDCIACIPREGILHAVKSPNNRLHCMHSVEKKLLEETRIARRSFAMIVRNLQFQENFGLMEEHKAGFKLDDNPADYLQCESGTKRAKMASGKADEKRDEMQNNFH